MNLNSSAESTINRRSNEEEAHDAEITDIQEKSDEPSTTPLTSLSNDQNLPSTSQEIKPETLLEAIGEPAIASQMGTIFRETFQKALPSLSDIHNRYFPSQSNDQNSDSSDGEDVPEGFDWIEKLPKELRSDTKRILKHGMTDEERQAIYNKFPIPENLSNMLLPPKVNPEVWDILPPEAKYSDISLCHIHKGFAHTVVAMGEALNSFVPLLQGSVNNKDKLEKATNLVSSFVTDSSAKYANLGKTVTEGRKDMIIKFLSPEAQEEAKFTIPDEFLFGKDFQNGRTSRMMKKTKGKIRVKRFRARR